VSEDEPVADVIAPPDRVWRAVVGAGLAAGALAWAAVGADGVPSQSQFGAMASVAGSGGGEGGGGGSGDVAAWLAQACGSPLFGLRAWAAVCSAGLAAAAAWLFAWCARSTCVGLVVGVGAVVVRPALGGAWWGTAGLQTGGNDTALALALGIAVLIPAWRLRGSWLGAAATGGAGLIAYLHLPTGLSLVAGLSIAGAVTGRTQGALVRAAAAFGVGALVALPAAVIAPPLADPRFVEIAMQVHHRGFLPPPDGATGVAFTAFAPLLLLSHLAWRGRRGSTQEPIVRWLAIAAVCAAIGSVALQGAAQLASYWNHGVPLAADLISGTRFLYLGALGYVAMGLGDFLRGRLFPVERRWRVPLLAVVGLALLVPPESIRRAVTADGRRAATLEAARARDLRHASAWLRANASEAVVATDESGFRVLAGVGVTHAEGDAPTLIRSASPAALQWAQRRSMWRKAWSERPPTLSHLLLLGGAFGADYVYLPVLLAPDDGRTVWRGEERALVKLRD
jgi:hypothetical protein